MAGGATVSPLKLEATILFERIGISHTIATIINSLGMCFLSLDMLLRAKFDTSTPGVGTGTRACLLGAQPSKQFFDTVMAPRAPSRGPVRTPGRASMLPIHVCASLPATAVKGAGPESGTGGGGSGSTAHLCQVPAIAPLCKKKKTRMRRLRAISRSVAAVIASVSDYFEKERRAGKAKKLNANCATVTSRPAMAMRAIGYAGPPTPSKLRMYRALATRAGVPRSRP
jgi:hypothetical protein